MAGWSPLLEGGAIAASDHFRLLGDRGASDPPLLSAGKITNWDTRSEVLCWIIDTQSLTLTLPFPKRLKLRVILSEWPPSGASALAKQVSQLVGFLMHVSFAFRPGVFFAHRMLASVGMPRIAAGVEYARRMANHGRRVALGPEFHGDLEFWRWFVSEGLVAVGGILSAPMYHLLERPAQRTLFSDASKNAIGVFCLEAGVYWRCDLSVEKQSRFWGSSRSVAGMDGISINVLELVGMTISAWVLVSSFAERPSATGDCVCCVETTKPPCSGCGGVAAVRNRGRVRSCTFLTCSNCPLGDTSMRNTCEEYFMWRPMVSHAGMAPPSSLTCVLFAPTFRGRRWIWGTSGRLSVLRCWPRTHAKRRCGRV